MEVDIDRERLTVIGEALYQQAIRKRDSYQNVFDVYSLAEYRLWLESLHEAFDKEDLPAELFANHVADSFRGESQTIHINGEFGSIYNYASSTEKFLNLISKQIEFLKSKNTTESLDDFVTSFDEATSILSINDFAVKIAKFKDQYHLLRIIYSDKTSFHKEHFFSDIAEQIDLNQIVPDKKYSNAARQIALKLRNKFDDFFIITRQSITVNPKYHMT